MAMSGQAPLGCSFQHQNSYTVTEGIKKPVRLSNNVMITLTLQSLTLTDKDCKFSQYYRNIDTKNMFIPDCGSAGQGGNGNNNLRT